MFRVKSKQIQTNPSKSKQIRENPRKSKFKTWCRTGGDYLNRLSFIILSILYQGGASSSVTAMTLKEIVESEDYGYKPNTVSKKLKEFELSEYVSKGLKDGRADTFFITEKGCLLLDSIRGKEGK